MPPNEIHDNRLYERGLRCVLWGRKAEDMTRDELVTFVGYLDEMLEAERLDAAT